MVAGYAVGGGQSNVVPSSLITPITMVVWTCLIDMRISVYKCVYGHLTRHVYRHVHSHVHRHVYVYGRVFRHVHGHEHRRVYGHV